MLTALHGNPSSALEVKPRAAGTDGPPLVVTFLALQRFWRGSPPGR
jgi:hypothetical protein